MKNLKRITGSTPDEIWTTVAKDMDDTEILDYEAMLQQTGLPEVQLKIDIDPGGGFESGYESTRLMTPITVNNDFRFSLHHESFLDKAGKFLGFEDRIIGYPEFDKEFIIKTNNEQKVKAAFSDPSVRSFFQSLRDFTLHIEHHAETVPTLELEIDRGITDVAELRTLYDAFCKVLLKL